MKNLFIIFIFCVFLYSQDEVKPLKYNFIEIEECFFPISKNLKLLEKNAFSYNYVNRSSTPFHYYSVRIIKKVKHSYRNFLKKIESDKDFHINLISKRGDFQIIRYNYKNDYLNQNDNIYKLIGLKSEILINSVTEKEINYMIDYCTSTKKK